MKCLSIVGARPQFVKLAPFSRALRENGWDETIIHTGQHYDANMSDLFFEELGIPAPDHNLAIGSGEPGAQTGRMLEGIERLIGKARPDAVIVFGDTNSTLAGALAASKSGIPVVHVEAGLRSFNRVMPEEINRVLADHVSDLLLAPTETAMKNLDREGLSSRACLTGDIMVDAVKANCMRAATRSGILEELGVEAGAYSVLTLHRPYTVDNPAVLETLLEKLCRLDEVILFPVHPRTRKTLERIGYRAGNLVPMSQETAVTVGASRTGGANNEKRDSNLRLIEPVGYLDFLCLQSNAKRILTDSGGIQKEAYILGKPCVTLRPETEWVETVEAGWNLLLPPHTPDMAERIARFAPPPQQPAVFGENVTLKMVGALRECLNR